VCTLAFNMLIEFMNVHGKLFHSRVGFTDAGALVNNPSLDALDIGGNFIYRSGGFAHVSRKVGSYF